MSQALSTVAASVEQIHPQLDTDVLLDALAHEERRELLIELGRKGTVDVDHLVARVVCAGDADRLADGSGETAMRFHHIHLPKLEDVGLIEYDHELDIVELTDVGVTVVTAIR